MTRLIDSLIPALGKHVGIPQLNLDDSGWCALFVDELVINIEYRDSSEQLFIYTPVGVLPAENREPLYRELLEANCFFRGTQGGCLSVDSGAGVVLLSFSWPVRALCEAELIQLIENVVNVAETWSKRLRRIGSRDPAPAGGDSTNTPITQRPFAIRV